MKKTKQLQWLAGAAVLLALIAAAYWMSPKFKDPGMNSASASSPMPTLCVGRYLVDVPANYKLEHYKYRIDGVDMFWQFKVKDQAGFDSAVNQRKVELTAEKNEYEKPSLEESQELTFGEVRAVVLPYGRTTPNYWYENGKKVNGESDNLSAEAWVWTGTHALQFDAKGLGPGYAQKALTLLIEPLKSLAAGAIPVEEGFCMEMFDARALIAAPPRAPDTYEEAEVQFGLKDHPDVKFRLSFLTNVSNLQEPLSARHARTKAERGGEYTGRVSELRDGMRSIRQMEGYELVQAFRELNGTRGISFDWEWLGKVADPLAPNIALEAKTGYSRDGPVNSSMSDQEALKLWDAVAASIRLRPTAKPAKTSAAAPPKAPLGELAATGRACPQSGWWQCAEESSPVQGGKRRFFQAGERMPHAVLLGEPSVWQRLKGEQPSYATATVWQLVDYEAPPVVDSEATSEASKSDSVDAEPSPSDKV